MKSEVTNTILSKLLRLFHKSPGLKVDNSLHYQSNKMYSDGTIMNIVAAPSTLSVHIIR